MQKSIFINEFCDNYDLSSFISLMAFLPSLRVLNTSQERDETIRKVSEINEIRVVLKLISNLPTFFNYII